VAILERGETCIVASADIPQLRQRLAGAGGGVRMPDLIAVLCILSLLGVLGGSVLFLLYGVRGTVAMLRQWLDSR
jgi:hypothetical protein